MDDDAGTTILDAAMAAEGLIVDVPIEAIEVATLSDGVVATRFSAEDWKQRALYEQDRRQHIEQELLRLRDELDRVIRRAAVVRREPPS
jgi:hypothetical protein